MRLALCLLALLLPQQGPTVPGHTGAIGAGVPTIAFVNSGGDFTGGGSLNTGSWHPLAGNHLIVWTFANDRVTTHTCSDNAAGGSNTYVADGSILAPTANLVGIIFHVKTISNSGAGSLTITCTGTTPGVAAIEYSGGTGDLDTAASGTNPSGNASDAFPNPITPTAFTTSAAGTILVDGYASITGDTVTLSQVDGSFTTRQSCLTGASCFVGAIGTRIVSSTASYSDGWNESASGAAVAAAMLGAYK